MTTTNGCRQAHADKPRGEALTSRRILWAEGLWLQPCPRWHSVMLGPFGIRGGATQLGSPHPRRAKPLS